MKKSILLGIAGLAIAGMSSYGQGYIQLDNYLNSAAGSPAVTYGAGVPANGQSGAVGSGGLNSLWTVGLYFVTGTPSITDPAGTGLPNAALALGTGAGSTVQVDDANVYGTPGAFSSTVLFNISGTGTPTVTVELIAYLTSAGSYANSTYRGHSAPFTMPSAVGNATTPISTQPYMSAFSVAQVAAVPEPGTLALAGLGGFGMLMAMRRKKA